MSEVLIFSDIHVSAHKKSFERLDDCLRTLEWVFETAKKHKIKEIIFAGDLFQDRQKIDVITYSKTFDVLFKYCTGEFNLYLLLGNHDLWYHDRWDVSSVLPFSALPSVKVINKPDTIKIHGVPVYFLPYTHDPINHLKELLDAADPNFRKTLVGHLACHGAILNSLYNTYSDVIIEHDGEMVQVGEDAFEGWDKVWLGHYHCPHQIGNNIEYIGSPLQLTFGEAFQDKHIIIYDLLNGETQYIENGFSPKHIISTEEDIFKHEIGNNFIRISASLSDKAELIDFKKNVEKKLPSTLEIVPNVKREEQKELVARAKELLQREDDMIETFVNVSDTGDLDKKHLIEIVKKIIVESA